ncbi:cyclopropane-fatty-acyl-phospholipid synthase, partial [Aureobasidium melanogenum]
KQVVNGSSEKSVYSLPNVVLTVHKDVFWVRMLLFADMGFAESYMLGEVSCSDLTEFFRLFILNRAHLSNGSTLTSNLSGKLSYLLRKTNTLTTARLNIAAHYDISNDMFAAFLSPDMTYSCPIWLPKSDPQSSEETLEQAQMRKLRRFITNAKIKQDDHVLEIGTGWGSFAILAVRETGCRVTSLTLSI